MLTIPRPFGGLVIPRARGVTPTLVFLDYRISTADLSTYSFTSVPLGTAAANRHIIVAVHSSGVGARVVNSLGVEGNAAGQAVFSNSAPNTSTGIYIASVPSGTSGTISVTYTATQARAAIGVWAAYGLASTTPEAINTGINDTSNDLSLTGLPEFSVVVSANTSISSPTFSWNSLEIDYWDVWSDTSGSNQQFAGASLLFEAGGNLSVTAGSAGGDDTNAVIAAFR